jgi:hypothetical protein
METIISIIFSVVATWLFAHYYYRKQSKEQINPIPHIKGVHEVVLELYGMAIDRKDTKLQEVVKRLITAMLFTRNRVVNSIIPASFTLMMIDDACKHESEDEMRAKLKEIEPMIMSARKRLTEVGEEYDGLFATTQTISGVKVGEMFTDEEFKQILRDPRNQSRLLNRLDP